MLHVESYKDHFFISTSKKTYDIKYDQKEIRKMAGTSKVEYDELAFDHNSHESICDVPLFKNKKDVEKFKDYIESLIVANILVKS